MNLTIGSLVLCYLLAPSTNQNNQNVPNDQNQDKIIKVWGKVVEFKERDALYDKDQNTPIAYVQRVDDLVVKGINRKGIYQVSVNACKHLEKLPKGADKPQFEEVRLEKEKIDIEIDENYDVVEKNKLEEEMSKQDQEEKREKIKAIVAEKIKKDAELKKKYLAEQAKVKAKEKKEEELAKDVEGKQTPSQVKGQKEVEEKGVLDYLFDK